MIGQYLGGYRILRPIGSGCMGHVYEAINGPLGRRAAIKVLRPEWAASWEVARRFLNEARAVNAVKHPGLVDIYQAGRRADGILYLVMEYLDGESLFSRLQRRGTWTASSSPGRSPRPWPRPIAAASSTAISSRGT